ncbi:hypothetical protein VOLCADRAFT_94233 [Volvox carteri f. nagariensis]|uniref:Uncharacterized protein n=1 Tax=Volvox carteri f. nagariensis TaxID=3068 RepID=D8U4H6_VOLCA|nr:uncharacterized protein VOLCADRAFT_94233 [Volvox carteri f. nagariensis]EFJ45505.1 hypothetical protein VOLCADRAFT_94233 [Volvox carteri f. nagariensis]|eukprot:XP_002953532.1 hypothetical protein VOLCADRAFT_94233 [Volvox carteri f. nagariensis]
MRHGAAAGHITPPGYSRASAVASATPHAAADAAATFAATAMKPPDSVLLPTAPAATTTAAAPGRAGSGAASAEQYGMEEDEREEEGCIGRSHGGGNYSYSCCCRGNGADVRASAGVGAAPALARIIQLRCEQCGGRGLVASSGPGRDRYLRKCPQCGGFFPWISWKLFLTSTAAPGNGGPLQQPRGQRSVLYSIPEKPDPVKQAEALARSQAAVEALQAAARPREMKDGHEAELGGQQQQQ